MRREAIAINSFFDDIAKSVTDTVDAVRHASLQPAQVANSDYWGAFDMVVSVPEYVINSQLDLLGSLGTVPDSFRIYQDSKTSYKVLPPYAPIPAKQAYLTAALTPRIKIAESGNNVLLLLNLSQAEIGFWNGSGPDAEFTVKHYDSLVYALSVC
jgi:hypothetical protein